MANFTPINPQGDYLTLIKQEQLDNPISPSSAVETTKVGNLENLIEIIDIANLELLSNQVALLVLTNPKQIDS